MKRRWYVEGLMAEVIAPNRDAALILAEQELPDFIAVGARYRDRAGRGYSAAENSRVVGSTDTEYFWKVEMRHRSTPKRGQKFIRDTFATI